MLYRKLCGGGVLFLLILGMIGCGNHRENNNEMSGNKERVSPTHKISVETTGILGHTVVPENIEIVMPTSSPTPMPTVMPTSSPTPMPTVMPTSTPAPAPIVVEELEEGYLTSLMVDTEWKVSEMVHSGELSGYVAGFSKFLVWKITGTNITGPKIRKFALINCLGDYETEFVEFEKQIEYPENIESIGDNIFKLFTADSSVECYNANTGQYFSYPAQCDIFVEFSDGYALGYLNDTLRFEDDKYSSIAEYYYDVVFLNECGELFYTPLEYKKRLEYRLWGSGSTTYSNAGRFSEGYFFFEDAFYNIDAELVLNLEGVVVTNKPYFENGCCWIEYEEAGAMWGAYIDIRGDFLAEPAKLYDLY